MPVLPSRIRHSRRFLHALVVVGLLLGLTAIVVPPASAAVGAPVLIDDFGGLARGRTVTPLPLPNTSTTRPGTFTESGGLGTLVANGSGNGQGGVQLDYDFPALDLTSGVSNSQFFLEFKSIQRTPEVIGESSILVSIAVTDSTGKTGTFQTGLGNTTNFNVVLNFFCSPGQSACFSPQVNFASVTHIRVSLLYPRNVDPGRSLTAVLDTIRTTPPGGVAPPAPTPQIVPPTGNPVFGLSGSTVSVPINFRSTGTAVPVTVSPVTQQGLRAQDVHVTSTATGATNVAVSGGPSDYVATLGPITSSGPITVSVPAGVVVDAWAQGNLAGSATFNYVAGSPPTVTPPSRTLTDATKGQAYSQNLTTSGTPTPTWTVTGGSLPPGLTLSSGGLLAGTPTTAGAFTFTATATNPLGSASQSVSVRVLQSPSITSLNTATFNVGETGTFLVATTGFPGPAISVDSGTLPAGLTLTDNGNGTATLAGTPTGPAGIRSVGLLAQSVAGTALQDLTIRVQDKPVFTSPATATYTVGVSGSFTVSTDGLPDAVITSGPLPAGLFLTDNGNGTAIISGTPTGSLGSTSVELKASNVRGFATQTLTVNVTGAPVVTNAGTAPFTVGQEASFVVTAGGFPAPALTLTGQLPPGLTFVDHGDGTGTLSGTPQAPGGVHSLTVTATNAVNTGTQELSVVVSEAPAITSADQAVFLTDTPGSFTVATSGFPDPSITSGPLPAGLTLTDNGDGTATISGTPTGTPDSTPTTVTATNDVGSASQVLDVVVRATPVITSATSASFDVGVAGSFTIIATGTPVPTIESTGPVPAGLVLTDQGDGTATLAGTPTKAGVTTVGVKATNAAGTDQEQLRVVVSAAPGSLRCGGLAPTIVAGASEVTVLGTSGPDVIVGSVGTTTIRGGGGNDTICAPSGAVALYGGQGADMLRGGGGPNHLVGGAGNDVLTGRGGDDRLIGGRGDDRLKGNQGADRLVGGVGDDTLVGRGGPDHVVGGLGDDVTKGGGGNDRVLGGAGDDRVVGGFGRDHCNGGAGLDTASSCEVLSGIP